MRPLGIFGAALLVAAAAGATFASCGGTPAPVPIRTFLQPQKVDFVCLNVNDANGLPIRPQPAIQAQCPPVPVNVYGGGFAFHNYALVTQTTRGELGVVDLTLGSIVDEDRATPGVNFIPVGADPTDVVVTPDGAHTYVTSADPNLPAVYGIDNRLILGDSQTLSPRLPPLNNFNQIAACRLPQPADAVVVIPMPSAGNADAGSPEGGTGSAAPAYALAVLLRSQGPSVPAQVAVIEAPTQLGGLAPCNFLGMTGALSSSLVGSSPAAGAPWPDGVPFADAGDLSATEPAPGPMMSCPTPTATAAMGIVPAPGIDAAIEAASPGPADAQADSNAVASEADASDAGDGSSADAADAADAPEPADAGAEAAPMVAASADSGLPQGTSGLTFGPLSEPRPTSMVLRDDTPPVVYVADGAIPVIHVIDLSNPAQPREVSTLLATSQEQPARRVSVGGLALSPVTRDYRRYLYAIDSSDGTLMVYDVTAPIPAPFTPPLERPHAELNPFTPRDRISFGAPVAAVSFAYNEWPLPPSGDAAAPAQTGLLCNPNPNARLDGGAPGTGAAAGALYCADQAVVISPQGTLVQGLPTRLRGWFGFAVLTNGNVAVIDLDDWDAPCRRPDPMTASTRTGVLDLPEPASTGPTDLDPYHVPTSWPGGPFGISPSQAPNATQSAVTQEQFFPVSAPNRPRSSALLRNDPTAGIHIPYVVVTPQLTSNTGAPLSTDPSEPVILPTALSPGFVDPSNYTTPVDPHDGYFGVPVGDAATLTGDAGMASEAPGLLDTVAGVRVSFDDPTAHIDQDWWVTYEGALPSTSPLVANVFSTTDYANLTFSVGAPPTGPSDAGSDAGVGVAGGGFCAMGVEDWSLGQQRANAEVSAISAPDMKGLQAPPNLPQWTSDYVEITDDLLPSNDCYWQESLQGEGGLSGGCITGQGAGAPQASPSPSGGTCDWQGFDDLPEDQSVTSGKNVARNRYNLCQQTFGPPDNPTNGPYSQADNYLLRDFPIVEAYADHLVVGRFKWDTAQGMCPERTTNRSIFAGTNGDGLDPNNKEYFKLAQCCFHNQAAFKIRTGGEWSVVGQNGLGLLHHVRTDATSGRCVLSCDPNDVLLNGRAFDLPYTCSSPPSSSPPSSSPPSSSPPSSSPSTPLIDRGQPLAFRNPMFSFVMWQGGCKPSDSDAGADGGAGPTGGGGAGLLCTGSADHTTSQRDLSWRFTMRGGFTPLTFSIGGASAVPVVPQSVRPLPAFQQLAIVDGAEQGLILVDLHTLQFAHDPYF